MAKDPDDLTPQNVDRLKRDFSAVENEVQKINPDLRTKLDAKIKILYDDLVELAHFGAGDSS